MLAKELSGTSVVGEDGFFHLPAPKLRELKFQVSVVDVTDDDRMLAERMKELMGAVMVLTQRVNALEATFEKMRGE